MLKYFFKKKAINKLIIKFNEDSPALTTPAYILNLSILNNNIDKHKLN